MGGTKNITLQRKICFAPFLSFIMVSKHPLTTRILRLAEET